jgi:hypothetical protein
MVRRAEARDVPAIVDPLAGDQLGASGRQMPGTVQSEKPGGDASSG